MSLYRSHDIQIDNPEIFSAFTLVDITDSGECNPSKSTIPYRQAQNLNSLLQMLNMRSQLLSTNVRIDHNADLSEYNFGITEGKHTVWIMEFAVEQHDLWKKNNDSVYYANNDCNLIPIHTGLNETCDIKNMFITSNDINKNTYFISGTK